MDEQAQPVEPLQTPTLGGIYADRGVQEFRLSFQQELQELRIMLTGKVFHRGKEVAVKPTKGKMCTPHFEEMLSMISSVLSKSVTLTRIHESVAERLSLWISDETDSWLTANCLYCETCQFKGKDGSLRYSDISLLVAGLTTWLFCHLMRGAGGWEAERLSTMQTISSQEQFVRSDTQPRRGLFGWFGGRK